MNAGKGEHFLEFQCKELRRVIRMVDLPHLVDHRRCKAQRNHRGRYNGGRPTQSHVKPNIAGFDQKICTDTRASQAT